MNWFQKICQEGFRMRSECTGHHHGQTDCVIIAYMGDRPVGYLQYADFEGESAIQDIQVHKDYRRQGVATRLYEQLQAESESTIRHTMQTPDGAAWRDSLPN